MTSFEAILLPRFGGVPLGSVVSLFTRSTCVFKFISLGFNK